MALVRRLLSLLSRSRGRIHTLSLDATPAGHAQRTGRSHEPRLADGKKHEAADCRAIRPWPALRNAEVSECLYSILA